jgi:hypothetical protein
VVNFHRLLISTAIVFCAFFAVWGFREYRTTGTTWSIASAVAFAVFAVGFGVYLAFLKRFLGEK